MPLHGHVSGETQNQPIVFLNVPPDTPSGSPTVLPSQPFIPQMVVVVSGAVLRAAP